MKSIREEIRNILKESTGIFNEEGMMDEERIANADAKEFVKNKDNFLGTHLFGEKLGNAGDYVVCSYVQDFPIWIWDSNGQVWYENGDKFTDDGEVIEHTDEHKDLTRPTTDTIVKNKLEMIVILNKLMKRNGMEYLSHDDRPPGTK